MNLGDVFNPYQQFVGSFIPAWLERRSELSPGAKLVYARLCRYAGKSGLAFPNQHTLAAALGMSERTLREYLHELRKHRLIRSQQRGNGRSNGYVFLYHAWIKEAIEGQASAPGSLEQESAWQNLPPCEELGEQPGRSCRYSPAESAAPVLRESSEENQEDTQDAREDDTLVAPESPLDEPQDETPCVCESPVRQQEIESPAEEPQAPAAEPEPEPIPEPEPMPEPQAEAFAWEALTCGYDPAFPCEHQQDVAEVIIPIVGNYVRVKASDVPVEVAHRWTLPDVTDLFQWLKLKKAPDDPAWWRLRNAFSPKHRDDHLCMAKDWAASARAKQAARDAKRSAAVCPHPPSRIGYNPMLGQYHCFGCFRDVPVDVAAALGCDEHLDPEP